MGAVLNASPVVQSVSNNSIEGMIPNQADWLTAHADATGLAVVEVERLWARFIQLTGRQDQTRLHPINNPLPDHLSNDIFVRNFLKHFPRSTTDNDTIPFCFFIAVMKWLDATNIEEKLAAVFLYINNGHNINAGMIGVLFKYMYPDMPQADIDSIAKTFMRQIGASENGEVNQKQFVAGVLQFIPLDELEELLNFHIIPMTVVEAANRMPLPDPSQSMHPSQSMYPSQPINPSQSMYASPSMHSMYPGQPMQQRSVNNFSENDVVTDDELWKIATGAAQGDWVKLALSLGFVEYDIQAHRIQNKYDATATMYKLLRSWRENQGLLATKVRLSHCLRQSGLERLISILN